MFSNQFVKQIVLGFWLVWPSYQLFAANNQNLPNLGDYTSGIISLGQERAIGQDFLRSLRAGAPLVYDPVLQDVVITAAELPAGEILAAFTSLELKGLIKRLPGQLVVRVGHA